MCLITTQKKPVIATRKMTVYKFMKVRGNKIYSPHYSMYQWELGKLYKVVIKDDTSWCCANNTDMYWLNDNYPGWIWDKKVQKKLKCIGAGYHAVATKKILQQYIKEGGGYEENSIYKCTIPSGSKVYRDATGLIVSNQIIIESKYAIK